MPHRCPSGWRTLWTRYSAKYVEREHWRGAGWTGRTHLSEVIEHARNGEVGWIPAYPGGSYDYQAHQGWLHSRREPF